MESVIAGFVLIVIGGLQAVRADWVVRFQVWTQKTIMGAEYIPGERTYKIVRIVGALIMVMGFAILIWGGEDLKYIKKGEIAVVVSFEECVKAGNAVMESYPRQCRNEEQTFVENIGNTIEKADLIRLEFPRPNQIISSPLSIKGEARGNWFFEASFPVVLVNWDGLIIAQGIATAKSDPDANDGAGWMTTNFVPFEATLKFTADKNAYSNRGSLILRKDNPSGLPEHDDVLEIPVVILSF